MRARQIIQRINGMPASDGAGVKLTRSLGARPGLRMDPFLMLDEFSSDDAADYIGGFPPHPHRGFETVTYMLDGHMLHEDHLGNRGHLRAGDVQWMTAGRGVIHSEMPQQREGRMRGFQLWLNLPARTKMQPAAYRDIRAAEIPRAALPGGGELRLIAGRLVVAGQEMTGAVTAPDTEPVYADLRLPAGAHLDLPLPSGHAVALYLYEGELMVGGEALGARQLAVLGAGKGVVLTAGAAGAGALLLAGRPLGEPVAQYGPFVMNSRAEIDQALADYREGRLTAGPVSV